MELAPILDALALVPAPLAVAIISALPVLELRAGIPVALTAYHLPIWQAVLFAVIGNMIPAVAILFGWDRLVKTMETVWPGFHAFMERYHARLHKKWEASIDRYGPVALALFVAIPLPLSGVWSGAIVAWIFGLHRQQAFFSILAGVLIAAGLVTSVTLSSLRIF